jgi:hypothetical protein
MKKLLENPPSLPPETSMRPGPTLLFVLLVVLCLSLSSTSFAQCPAGSTIPSVNVCSPTNNATVGTEVVVSATARSNNPISAMKIYDNGVSVYTFHDSSINISLILTAGVHKLNVKAWDTTGAVFGTTVTVTASDNPPPTGSCTAGASNTVNICSPASGSTVGSPVDIEAFINASLTGTAIYLDGVLKWQGGSSQQISQSLSTTTGTHKLTVKGWTTSGTIVSTSETFSVGSGSTPPPTDCTNSTANTVLICEPVKGSTVTSPVDVEAAINSSSSVTGTKIYLDGVGVFTGTSAKVSANVSASTGSHTMIVKGWLSSGTVLQGSTTFTVGSGTPPPPPPPSGSISPRRYVTTPAVPVQFNASGATNWAVDGIVGGNSTVGTISSTGLYTPVDESAKHTITATIGTGTSTANVWVSNVDGVYNYKYDKSQTGANTKEVALTPSIVNTSNFGKLASYPVDGNVLGQPVYMAGVNIPNKGVHNVVFVGTNHDSVYAFDADGQSSIPLWKRSFINPGAGITTYPPVDACCVTEVGIAGTMVIDPATKTIYVVAATKENGSYIHRLHALDVTTGSDRANSPVTIQGSVAGTGDSTSGGVVRFQSFYHFQRAALLLSNGAVYVSFASYNDVRPYHGWIFGYDASTLQQIGVFCASPNGFEGGVWQTGGGPTVDASGAIYVSTGNGTNTVASGGRDYSQSVVKLDHNLNVIDYFTPFDWSTTNKIDQDLGASNVILFPSVPTGAPSHLAALANKTGNVYLMNYDQLGHFHSTSNSGIVQTLTGYNMIRVTPAYWNNSFYFAALDSALVKLNLTSTGFNPTPASKSTFTFPYPGTPAVVSANGNTNGIVWATKHSGGAAVLYAFDANDLTKLLWASSNTSRDTADGSVRFSVPMVVNGRMYMAGKSALVIYGLLP